MVNPVEVMPKLAALFYYASPSAEKGVSFETLAAEKQKPWLEMAEFQLVCLERLNLSVVPKSTKNQAEVEALLRDRIETTVRDFFAGIKIWKKGAIPQEELVARIFSVWKNL